MVFFFQLQTTTTAGEMSGSLLNVFLKLTDHLFTFNQMIQAPAKPVTENREAR